MQSGKNDVGGTVRPERGGWHRLDAPFGRNGVGGTVWTHRSVRFWWVAPNAVWLELGGWHRLVGTGWVAPFGRRLAGGRVVALGFCHSVYAGGLKIGR